VSDAATELAAAPPRRVAALRLLAGIGRPFVVSAHWLLLLAGLATAVLVEASRPASWRRTVRAEFHRTLAVAGVGSLPTVLIAGMLFGLAMVYQALYWLERAGQQDLLGTVLVTVLVRELAPVLVGLIVVGRAGAVMLYELGRIRAGRQYDLLRGLGIDPFYFLTLPRAVALALAVFCLTVLFIVTALLAGFLAGSLLGAVQLGLWDFLDRVLRAMGPSTYLLVPLKTLTIGFAVGLVSSATALRSVQSATEMARLLPNGYVRGVLACLLISGAVSMVL
jgi:phospholipid/cholesterol/gamma-HCH transport system permease protein